MHRKLQGFGWQAVSTTSTASLTRTKSHDIPNRRGVGWCRLAVYLEGKGMHNKVSVPYQGCKCVMCLGERTQWQHGVPRDIMSRHLYPGANGGIQSSALGATECPGAKDSERLSDGLQPQVET